MISLSLKTMLICTNARTTRPVILTSFVGRHCELTTSQRVSGGAYRRPTLFAEKPSQSMPFSWIRDKNQTTKPLRQNPTITKDHLLHQIL